MPSAESLQCMLGWVPGFFELFKNLFLDLIAKKKKSENIKQLYSEQKAQNIAILCFL